MAAWAPAVVTAAGAVAVALISLFGVLKASKRAAEAAQAASERNASTLIDVENLRATGQARAHLRELIADLGSIAWRRSNSIRKIASATSEGSEAEMQIARSEFSQSGADLIRAIDLVRLTTSDESIHLALRNLLDANRILFQGFPETGFARATLHEREEIVEQIHSDCGLFDKRAAQLVRVSAQMLARPHS